MADDQTSAQTSAPEQPQPRAPAVWRWPSAEASLTVLVVVAACYMFWVGRVVLMPLALAGIIAITLSPLVRRLERMRLNSGAAAAIVLVTLLALTALTVWRVLPSLDAFQENWPGIERRIERRLSGWQEMFQPIRETTEEVQDAIQDVTGADERPPRAVVSPADPAMAFLSGAAAFVAQLAFTLVLIFFILAERRNLKALIWRAFPNAERARVRATLLGMKTTISRYLLTVAVINAGLGVLTAIALTLIGFPQAPLWGLAVFVANFVPYVGPALVQVAALVIASLNTDSVPAALAPFLVIWTLNMIEGQLVTPWIVGRQVVLNPLVVLLAIAMGGWAWGIVGMVVAVPLLIIITGVVKFWNEPVAPGEAEDDEFAQAPFGVGNLPPGVLTGWVYHPPRAAKPN